MEIKSLSLHHETNRKDRVSWKERIGFGLGSMCSDGSIGTLYLLVNPIYNMVMGLSPAVLSILLFIQRLWDAIFDPFLGKFSDNFRSRWGRRIPLIAIGCPAAALSFAAIWWFPQEASPTWLIVHLLITSLIFYTAHTLFNMPFVGLRIEATSDYHERTRLAAVVLAFGFAIQIGSQWVFPLTQHSFFQSQIDGLRWVTGICAALFLLLGFAPVFLCKERAYATVAGRQPKITLGAALRGLKQNPPLLRIITARFVALFCYSVVGIFIVYMNTYYIYGGDIKRSAFIYGFLGSSYMVSAILCSSFLHPWIAKKVGKKRAFQIAACILMTGCLAKLIVYQPSLPWLQITVFISNGIGMSGMTLMAASMIADIADYNEFHTRRRDEAFLAAIMNWCDKMGQSMGALLSGFILVWIGFDAKFGAQSPATLHWMKLSYCFVPFIGASLAILVINHYGLDEDQVYALRQELEKRRAENIDI